MRIGFLLCLVALAATASAQTQSWVTLSHDIETIIIGVSFINETHGWLPGDENGVGALFLRTTDGGLTWLKCAHEGYVTLPMGIAMQKTSDGGVSGVISGIGIGRNFTSMSYTTDGLMFKAPSPNPNFVGDGQDAKAVGGAERMFALPGGYTDNHNKNYNGLTLTTDGGLTWTNYDIGFANPLARYGSFPTTTTWYIAAGMWPSMQSEWVSDPDAKVLSRHLRIHKTKGPQFRKFMPEFIDDGGVQADTTTSTPYQAAIAKTTDGGKTWTTVYNDTGNFYFNDIFCWNAQKCWAVGEAENDSPNPGVRVLATTDGGATWNVQLYINDPDYSLMDVAFVSETEGWVVGGILTRGITGIFYQTTDGGATWVLASKLTDEYPSAVSFVHSTTVPSGYLGWASAFTREGASSILAYKY